MGTEEALEMAIKESIEVLGVDDQLGSEGGGGSRWKWQGAWWHMATFLEMGESWRIPESSIHMALDLLKLRTWPKFVVDREDGPQRDEDRSKMDCCHCELAVFYMILRDWGVDVDVEVPWIRAWFLKHQLPDGGLNCTPDAYGDSMKSSLVSTLPPLEAVLLYTDCDYTEEEKRFLDEGARYLIEHRLCRAKADGRLLNEDWLKPSFPRFFEYDILRGMRFLVEWSRRREKSVPAKVLREGLQLLEPCVEGDSVFVGSRVWGRDGRWESESFRLLLETGQVGHRNPWLSEEYRSVLASLRSEELPEL
ncbi:MAG: hypothetical protein AAGB46_06915 [Verrucomicrobiota bacterium]